MTQNEALKLALKALETAEIDGNCEYGATEIIRKALTQPERTWVGLTDEEISAIDWKSNETLHDFAKEIEAKLKQLNHGS
jgi:ribosomal protein S13